MILARHGKLQALHHGLDCDILNILRYSLAFGGDWAMGLPQSSEAVATNIVTPLAYRPYGRAEVFPALAAPELIQEHLWESQHFVFRFLGVLQHYQSNIRIRTYLIYRDSKSNVVI